MRPRDDFVMIRRVAIPEILRRHPTEAVLLVALLGLADHRTGTVTANIGDLAEETGLGASTVKYNLRKLENSGEVEWHRARNQERPGRIVIRRYGAWVLDRAPRKSAPLERAPDNPLPGAAPPERAPDNRRATAGQPVARRTPADQRKRDPTLNTQHSVPFSHSVLAASRQSRDRGEGVGSSESERNFSPVATEQVPGSADPLGDDDWEGRRARMLAELKRRYGEQIRGGGR